jgi:hypothetical protein
MVDPQEAAQDPEAEHRGDEHGRGNLAPVRELTCDADEDDRDDDAQGARHARSYASTSHGHEE